MEKAVGIGTRVVQREKIGWKGGAGMDEKKKERKGKRAMKPRRKNGINSLPFFSKSELRNAALDKKNIPIYTV